jgi:hypothetical protein
MKPFMPWEATANWHLPQKTHFLHYEIIEATKNLKNQPRPLF